MLVYRIGKTKFAYDLSGEGARLNGGRWNPKGIPCLYTASSISLAILEISVNTSLEEMPRALSLTTIRIPDDALEMKIEELPGNWNHYPSPSSTREFGGRLLNEARHLSFRLPSSVISREFNYIINPLHPQMKQVKIVSVEDFVFDVRIKK